MNQMMELPDQSQADPAVCYGKKDAYVDVSQAWT